MYEIEDIVNTIICGNSKEELQKIPSESINCCITSPPYWALRDYQLEPIEWSDGWRGSLGLEPTFELYLKHLWQIFDEVKRVLKKTGTCWVNLGDSYSGSGCGTNDYHTEASKSIQGIGKNVNLYKTGGLAQRIKDVPAKSLCQIPSRFSIGMTDKGWILRNELIWWKRNCMPSSVKDRFTVDFEKIFFFVKQKKYWFEQQYEEYAPASDVRYRQRLRAGKSYNLKEPYKQNMPYHSIKRRSDDKDGLCVGGPKMPPIGGIKQAGGDNPTYSGNTPEYSPQGRNRRCVWDIVTQPFKDAHFAVFPEALVEPMVKAGCPKGGIVLDPFAGAGTSLLVAQKLNRNYLGIELNPEYIKIAERRLAQKVLSL